MLTTYDTSLGRTRQRQGVCLGKQVKELFRLTWFDKCRILGNLKAFSTIVSAHKMRFTPSDSVVKYLVIIMNFFEKFFSLLAIIFAAGLVVSLIYFPQLRQIHLLIPISLVGLVVNVALIFIVLKDVFSRRFYDQNRKYVWIVMILLFWPSIIYYLYSYGFRPREVQQLP